MRLLLGWLLLGWTTLAEARLGRRYLSEQLDELPDEVPILVRYKNQKGRRDATAILDSTDAELSRIQTVAGKVNKHRLRELERDPNIALVEKDDLLFKDSSLPEGIGRIQGGGNNTLPLAPGTGSCSDPNSIKVAIIDDGLAVNHPDIQCGSGQNSRCMGKSWNNKSKWDQPDDSHGTHVAGVIGAQGKFIKGMIDDGDLCFVIARVFEADGVRSSVVLSAVEWAVDVGAKIINLSLGGGGYSETAESVFVQAYEDGALIFASAGNAGTARLNFPASYKHVTSVGAAGAANQVTDFSNFNDEVDLAAPGTDILSTIPDGKGDPEDLAAFLRTTSGYGASGTIMEGTQLADGATVTGLLVDCGLGESKCPGSGGHICVIERGSNFFSEKALNCEQSKAAAAIIYNHGPGHFLGTVGDEKISIPVFEALQSYGHDIISNHLGEVATIEKRTDYEYATGTSMASPHAAGAAALIWRQCPDCSNTQVIQCLESSAMDIGPVGKDVHFGNGLVQAEAAFECLSRKMCCSSSIFHSSNVFATVADSEPAEPVVMSEGDLIAVGTPTEGQGVTPAPAEESVEPVVEVEPVDASSASDPSDGIPKATEGTTSVWGAGTTDGGVLQRGIELPGTSSQPESPGFSLGLFGSTFSQYQP